MSSWRLRRLGCSRFLPYSADDWDYQGRTVPTPEYRQQAELAVQVCTLSAKAELVGVS